MLARIMNFLNNLSIARKLVLSLSLFLAPILYLIFAIWNDKQELITFAQSEIAGAHYIDVLRDIEADLVQADAAAFAQDGAKVADVEARFGQSFGTGEAAALLAAAFRAPSPSDAATLLASVQGLIGKVADGSNLTLDTDLDSYYLMDATTGKVPDLIARLANLASAARNLAHEAQPSVEAQSNLLVIEGGVGPVMDGLGASLGSAFTATKEASIERALAAPLASTQKAVADDVKSAHQIAFRQRTSAQDELAPTIAALSGLGQSGSSELVRLLEARIGRFHHALTVEFSITFALFAAGVAFTLLALQFGLVRPIGALTTVMRRLAAGDLAFDMPVARRRDEVGAMAGALQVFRDEAQHSRDLQRERTEAEARRANEDEQVRLAAEQAASAEAARLVVSSIGLGLERLAGCDLLFSLNGSLPATYEKLRIDYNNAVATLRSALAKVADDVTAVHGSAAEISSAATDLSQRTEQQAASLEEATSALEQITTTVRKTVGNSGQMRVAVGAAQKEAKQSEIVVLQAIDAMSEIRQSSNQIEHIIGVIDEIAFQTNLLALNAGVEAARAGDAGRGFAVVASEVRALAQRSAEAAKEIKGLISTSSSQVAAGVDLVAATGQALKRIDTQIASANLLVDEMADAARDQATRLGEINTAMHDLDRVTQQNTAMVEQSTAASRSLADQAERLFALVRQFRVTEQAAHHETRRSISRAA